jgi:hypothetical protein
MTEFTGVEEIAIKVARRTWQHFWSRYDVDGRVADGIVAILTKGQEQDRLLLQALNSLVEKSTTDPWIYDELREAAADLLRENWLMIPTSLRLFAADVLAGTRQRPTRRGPRLNKILRFRDLGITLTVDVITERFGIAAYSGGEMKGLTAVSIVREALKREGENISLDTIIKAYKQKGAR